MFPEGLSNRLHQASGIARRTTSAIRKPFEETTDLDIDDHLRNVLGIKTIFSVPCSITDTLHSRWQQDNGSNGFRLGLNAHEHSLVGQAAGWYFGKKEIPMIHMQNSGLPNAGDGLISFAQVYKIPIFGMVTWRGDSEKDDSEPHQEIGMRTDRLTRAFLNNKNVFGSRRGRMVIKSIDRAFEAAQNGEQSFVRLSSQGFRKILPLELPLISDRPEAVDLQKFVETIQEKKERTYSRGRVSRSFAIQEVVFEKYPFSAICMSNGFTAREGQASADRLGNFYNVGYMGGVLAITRAMAEANPDIDVVALIGDQNALMDTMTDQLTSEALLGRKLPNHHVVILHNSIGASVGVAGSPYLPDHYYSFVDEVILTEPDPPNSFRASRVKGVGSYFVDDEARALAEKIGPLPVHAARFIDWVEQASKRNRMLKEMASSYSDIPESFRYY